MNKRLIFFAGISLVCVYVISILLILANPLLFIVEGEGYILLMECLIKNVYLLALLTAILVIGIKLTKVGYAGIVDFETDDKK